MDNLDYGFEDVCDCLAQIQPHQCAPLAWSHWEPYEPVLTGVTTFQLEDDGCQDTLFIEVKIPWFQPGDLYVLAFKLDGSPE
jgi:hypothetical protein